MLPADGLKAKIDVTCVNGAKAGSVVDFVCFVIKDLVAQGRSNMPGNADPASSSFGGIAEFAGAVLVVHGLVEMETQVGTDVSGLTCGQLKGYATNAVSVHMI